jgi:hypothetical protein
VRCAHSPAAAAAAVAAAAAAAAAYFVQYIVVVSESLIVKLDWKTVFRVSCGGNSDTNWRENDTKVNLFYSIHQSYRH